MAQGVKDSHACAHERSGFFGRQFVWNQRQRFRRRDHVLGVPTIEIDPGDLAIHTHCEIAAPASITNEVVTAVPANPDTIAFLPVRDALAESVNPAPDFVPRHTRILQSWP